MKETEQGARRSLLLLSCVSLSPQESLNALVSASGPFCRVFVRPSGTEDAARIYAEAIDSQETQRLAAAAETLVLEAAKRHLLSTNPQLTAAHSS